MEGSVNVEVIQVYHHDPCDKGKGGVVRYISNLLKYLPKKGVKTSLYGAGIIECDDTFNFEFKPIIKGSNDFLRYFLNLFLKLPFLRIDEGITMHMHRIEYVIPFVIFKRNNPVLLTLHGERLATARSTYSKNVFRIIDKLYYLLEKIAFKRANSIVAVSSRVKNSFVTTHNTSDLKIKVIPVGTDLTKFKPLDKKYLRNKFNISEKTTLILYVGLLEPRKNVKLLLNGFKLFNDQIYDSVLFLVGDGPEKASLQTMANELGISSKVKFAGEVQNDNLPSLYSVADIFAFPSFSEGSPTVVRESLACGTPIVSTDVGDVKDIIHNSKSGLITDYDIKTFSGALIKLESILRNDGSVKEKCLQAVKPYSFDTVAEEYIKIYRKLRV